MFRGTHSRVLRRVYKNALLKTDSSRAVFVCIFSLWIQQKYIKHKNIYKIVEIKRIKNLQTSTNTWWLNVSSSLKYSNKNKKLWNMQQKHKNDKNIFRTAFTEITSGWLGYITGAFSKIFMEPTDAHFRNLTNFMIKVFCRKKSRLSIVTYFRKKSY